jgi:uncharacterized membrane protein
MAYDPYPTSSPDAGNFVDPLPSVVTVANLVYALHSLALVIGIVGTATVIGSFFFSIPSFVAVVINYVKRDDARGTFVESHFSWQIRTFWYGLLWIAVLGMLFATIIGIPFAFAGVGILSVWVIYRIARGWLRLRDRRPMYV